jgi:hypothetical protein
MQKKKKKKNKPFLFFKDNIRINLLNQKFIFSII